MTRQLAITSKMAHTATVHGQGLFCMVFVPSKIDDGENKSVYAPTEEFYYSVALFPAEGEESAKGHTCHIMASKSSVGTLN